MTAADRLEAAARALHEARVAARAGHPPEHCPFGFGGWCIGCDEAVRDWPDLSEKQREEYRRTVRVAASVHEPAVAEGAIWERRDERTAEALAEALGAPIVAGLAIVAGLGEDALVGYVQALATERDRATARAELAEAADVLLRQVLAEALESGAAKLHDAGAWQQFVERVLTTPTTPGVEALREVVAAARQDARPLPLAGAIRGEGTQSLARLRAALARLDACAAGRKGASP